MIVLGGWVNERTVRFGDWECWDVGAIGIQRGKLNGNTQRLGE